MASNLESLPNIGPVLAERLRTAGVMTSEDLLQLGDAEAFARLRHTLPEDACGHTRLALAGAVRKVRYHELPRELKAALVAGLKG